MFYYYLRAAFWQHGGSSNVLYVSGLCAELFSGCDGR